MQVRTSTHLLSELATQGIPVILCNERHIPNALLTPLHQNHFQSGRIQEQIQWQSQPKDAVWKTIVKLKIDMQGQSQKSIFGYENELMSKYKAAVLDGDISNMEGMAARIHFNTLFGKDFVRHEKDNINVALNYGYTILLSHFVKIIISQGYLTNLGIHHASESNPFNFACDLMEPFRPIVDKAVYLQQNQALDKEFKRKLINLLYSDVVYDKKQYQVYDVVEPYVLDCIHSISDSNNHIKEFRFK